VIFFGCIAATLPKIIELAIGGVATLLKKALPSKSLTRVPPEKAVLRKLFLGFLEKELIKNFVLKAELIESSVFLKRKPADEFILPPRPSPFCRKPRKWK
jgi:hypothetical protein